MAAPSLPLHAHRSGPGVGEDGLALKSPAFREGEKSLTDPASDGGSLTTGIYVAKPGTFPVTLEDGSGHTLARTTLRLPDGDEYEPFRLPPSATLAVDDGKPGEEVEIAWLDEWLEEGEETVDVESDAFAEDAQLTYQGRQYAGHGQAP
ncbi:hypothetical protein [Streptomyces alboflavus]|uniref:hypothetical protein n=1 Tax=Streptomyces alboflavus TaxID=67267 RepID=UPI000F658787|nr:hypothetical protein [Streptomyces alboflavus]